MGRSSSIGSPLLSIIRAGAYQSSPEGSPSIIPPKVCQFLSETSPRAFKEAMTRLFVLDVTVSVWPCLATRDGFLAKTTFLTMVFKERSQLVTEYWWAVASQLSLIEELSGQRVPPEIFHNPGGVRSYRVWTLPGISPLARKARHALLSDGLQAEASPV